MNIIERFKCWRSPSYRIAREAEKNWGEFSKGFKAGLENPNTELSDALRRVGVAMEDALKEMKLRK